MITTPRLTTSRAERLARAHYEIECDLSYKAAEVILAWWQLRAPEHAHRVAAFERLLREFPELA